MIRIFLVVQVPDASDERVVALFLGPVDRFPLRPGCMQNTVCMILHHIVDDS